MVKLEIFMIPQAYKRKRGKEGEKVSRHSTFLKEGEGRGGERERGETLKFVLCRT